MSLILAADIGGTNMRAAIIDHDGNILQEQRIQARLSDKNTSESDVIRIISLFLDTFIEKNHKVTAIGIGFPGFFIGNSGVLASSPNLPALNNFDLAGILTKQLKLPVFVQNDALCAAIGEHRFGAGKGHKNLLHITLGTGIGGGLILNGNPYTGEGGMAMEFGHLRVAHDSSARSCGCGGLGCVEAYASATAIISRYHEQTGLTIDAKSIYTQACNGDAIAQKIIKDAGTYLGMAIAEAVKLLDVRTITISGGLIGAWSLLHAPLKASLDYNLIPPLKGKIRVFHSTLGDNAGILGATAFVSHALNKLKIYR